MRSQRFACWGSPVYHKVGGCSMTHILSGIGGWPPRAPDRVAPTVNKYVGRSGDHQQSSRMPSGIRALSDREVQKPFPWVPGRSHLAGIGLGGQGAAITTVDEHLSQGPKLLLQGHPGDRASITVDEHLSQGREVLECLKRLAENARRRYEMEKERIWLAENRSKYFGKWIALEGGRLLAVADSAKEVFSKVANHPTPPLVIRISEHDLPFSGW